MRERFVAGTAHTHKIPRKIVHACDLCTTSTTKLTRLGLLYASVRVEASRTLWTRLSRHTRPHHPRLHVHISSSSLASIVNRLRFLYGSPIFTSFSVVASESTGHGMIQVPPVQFRSLVFSTSSVLKKTVVIDFDQSYLTVSLI